MMRKFVTLFAAFAVVATALAPVSAAARDHRGGYYDGRGDRYHHRRHRDDDNDALAAGVVGLVLGLAVGSLASNQNHRRDDGYYDRAPPPRQDYYRQGYEEPPRIYRDESYSDQEPYEACTERSWDTYNQRYVLTEVPC